MGTSFYKYQGTGNDLVVFVDGQTQWLRRHAGRLAKKLCSRRWSVGADGLLVLCDHKRYDFEVVYHNADGSQGMCGNGSRCAVHLARMLGIIEKKAHFLAADGSHRAFIERDLVRVQMSEVVGLQEQLGGYCLHTGSPQYVRLVEDVEQTDVCGAGQEVNNSSLFKRCGVNVSFAQLGLGNTLFVRTYERGVEGETLSCGTGAVAAALVASIWGYLSPVNIVTQGGILRVGFVKKGSCRFDEIYLEGPAKLVFQGRVDLSDQIQ